MDFCRFYARVFRCRRPNDVIRWFPLSSSSSLAFVFTTNVAVATNELTSVSYLSLLIVNLAGRSVGGFRRQWHRRVERDAVHACKVIDCEWKREINV